MTLGGKEGLAESFAAAIDWWREAGVDSDWQDEPKSWLAPAEAEAEPAPAQAPVPVKAAPPPPPPEAEPLAIPDNLSAFREWWLTEPRLDNGRTAGRVPPRGDAGSEVMLLVAEPEREDGDLLLSGPQGRLLAAMLAAMGIETEKAYFASALPRHTPHADWDGARRTGLGESLLRHVALAAPKRLIVFGANILPLLGHEPAQSPGLLPELNQEPGNIPMLAARDLGALIERPRWKAQFWRDWLDWTTPLSTIGAGSPRSGTETE